MKTTKRQKRALRRKWLAALRSGKFKQTRNALRDSAGFCCLGVMCEIARREFPQHKMRWKINRAFFAPGEPASRCGLPLAVCSMFGMRNDTGHFRRTALTTMNDRGKSFKDIAAYVEAHPDRVFRKETL